MIKDFHFHNYKTEKKISQSLNLQCEDLLFKYFQFYIIRIQLLIKTDNLVCLSSGKLETFSLRHYK